MSFQMTIPLAKRVPLTDAVAWKAASSLTCSSEDEEIFEGFDDEEISESSDDEGIHLQYRIAKKSSFFTKTATKHFRAEIFMVDLFITSLLSLQIPITTFIYKFFERNNLYYL